jgi:hypothetical protein
MRRLVSLLLAATVAVSFGTPVAGAQPAGGRYVSTLSSLSFAVPDGWELSAPVPRDQPVIEAVPATLAGQGRAASVIVTQLRGDSTGIAIDDYKAAVDAAAGRTGVLAQSSVQRIPAAASPSGAYSGVLQVLSVQRDGVAYEHVQFVFPVADREYTIGVTGGPGSAQDNVNDLGFIVGSLGF